MTNIQFANRMDGISGSAIREIFKLLSEPDMISFAGGNPAPETFPAAALAEISQRILAEQGPVVLQYGITEGYMPLRETVAGLVSESGAALTASDVLITSGSTQGIEIAAKALLNPGDTILVENPTFLGTLQALRLLEANIVGVETDEHGIMIDDLLEKARKYRPKMLYVIPTFQNPSGVEISERRRKAIVEAANEYGFFVLEDDPYKDLRYAGEDIPSIRSFDTQGRVITAFSFSKIVSPGLRVGAASACPELLQKMTICKQSADVHTNLLAQCVIDDFVRQGRLPGHLSLLRSDYAARMRTMLDLLDDCLPQGSSYVRPNGGLFIWVTLPGGYDAGKLFKAAVRHKVAFVPGTSFYCGGGHENTLRLNFSMSSPDMIKKGMAALKNAIKEYKE